MTAREGARIALAVVAACLLPAVGSAQQGLRSASLPDRTPPPLPSSPPDVFLARPGTYVPHPPRPGWFPPYFGGAYPSDYFDQQAARQYSDGYLQLQVTPASAQVFVDGLYLGDVNDIRQMVPGVPLEPGAHRLELRAPGYGTRTIELRIDPNDTRIYRDDLNPLAAVEPAPRAIVAAPPKTFYVIPGCYAGDKPPQADRMRPGCSISKTRTIPPVVSSVR